MKLNRDQCLSSKDSRAIQAALPRYRRTSRRWLRALALKLSEHWRDFSTMRTLLSQPGRLISYSTVAMASPLRQSILRSHSKPGIP